MRLFGPVAVFLLYFSAVLLLSEVRFKEMSQGVATYLKPSQHSNLHKNGDLFAFPQKTFILQNMVFFSRICVQAAWSSATSQNEKYNRTYGYYEKSSIFRNLDFPFAERIRRLTQRHLDIAQAIRPKDNSVLTGEYDCFPAAKMGNIEKLFQIWVVWTLMEQKRWSS